MILANEIINFPLCNTSTFIEHNHHSNKQQITSHKQSRITIYLLPKHRSTTTSQWGGVGSFVFGWPLSVSLQTRQSYGELRTSRCFANSTTNMKRQNFRCGLLSSTTKRGCQSVSTIEHGFFFVEGGCFGFGSFWRTESKWNSLWKIVEQDTEYRDRMCFSDTFNFICWWEMTSSYGKWIDERE